MSHPPQAMPSASFHLGTSRAVVALPAFGIVVKVVREFPVR